MILEPIGVVEPHSDFLEEVARLTRRAGALLVFDEIITGFRLSLGGAQEHFDVIPDLACFGKAMANGYPISAVVGRRDIMQVFDQVFFSFTFGGETVSLAAAVATINEIKERDVVSHLWEQGRVLQDGYQALVRQFQLGAHSRCVGLAPRTTIDFWNENGTQSFVLKSLFQQECVKRGVLFTGAHNICYSHTAKDIVETLDTYRAALEIVADAVGQGDARDRLAGKPVEPVFRQP